MPTATIASRLNLGYSLVGAMKPTERQRVVHVRMSIQVRGSKSQCTIAEKNPMRRVSVRSARSLRLLSTRLRRLNFRMQYRVALRGAHASSEIAVSEARGSTGRWEQGAGGEVKFVPDAWAAPAWEDARRRLEEAKINDPTLAAHWSVPVRYAVDSDR